MARSAVKLTKFIVILLLLLKAGLRTATILTSRDVMSRIAMSMILYISVLAWIDVDRIRAYKLFVYP